MAFGAYPQRRETDTSLERPFLDEAGAPNELLEALNSSKHERHPNLLSWHIRKAGPTYCRAVLITIACAFGIVVILLQSILLRKLRQEQWSHAEALGELNGIVPAVQAEPKLFAPDFSFDPLNMSDPGWEQVMPIGGGFVSIPDWQSKILPDPIRIRGKDLYNVAVFHQLHCLHVLAEEFDNLLRTRNTGYKSSAHPGHVGVGGSSMPNNEEGMMMYHIRHCLEYLKTSLTCCADTALEGQKEDINKPAADGFGSLHWAEKNRGTEQTGYPH
ncbi:hypothetical protein BKA65DRAFT_482265 [Rhexocercosporidium sp. MPI-PUGE-AT-0058]|nr:hypothetical protein BKA65DRAFT_482265 [Rhexocercosporidium sp. MPI-PUGE-AT-0058]